MGKRRSFFGSDFNSENQKTDYRIGIQLHIDGPLAQHVPLWQGLVGVGVTGYWYQPVDGDSGSGATFGSFRGRTNGTGPSASYTHAIGDHSNLAELEWVHELGACERPDGNSFILKAMRTCRPGRRRLRREIASRG